MTNWIRVEDRLPEYNEEVLLFCKEFWGEFSKSQHIGYRSHTNKKGENYRIFSHESKGMIDAYKVTHWKPLDPNPTN